MHISTIPGAVLPSALEDCTKPMLETFLSTRNVGGISALKKEQLGGLVKKKNLRWKQLVSTMLFRILQI